MKVEEDNVDFEEEDGVKMKMEMKMEVGKNGLEDKDRMKLREDNEVEIKKNMEVLWERRRADEEGKFNFLICL